MARDPVGRFVQLLRIELLSFYTEFFGDQAISDIEATMRAMDRRIDKALQQLNDEQKGEPHA